MLVSIIIPVYNAGKFLNKCLESVINQTHQDINIILVNDGSTDESGLICDEYAKKDNRITVVHKENGGVSSARNAGLRLAKGKYVSFLDPDDWIAPTMIENLVKLITDNKAELSICGFFKEKTDGTIIDKTTKSDILIYNQYQALNTILDSGSFKGYLCNKLFSLDVIRAAELTSDEQIHFCEDLLFTCQYILNSNKVIYDPTPYYHYIIHETNVSKSQFSLKKLTALDALEKIINVLKSREGIDLDKYKNYYMHMNISLLMNGIQEKKCDKQVRKQLRKNLFRYKISSLSDRIVKLSCIAGRINVNLLYLVWKIKQ